MKKIYSIIFALSMLTMANAQSENRVVEDFQVLKVSNALEIILTQGEVNEVIVEGETLGDIAKVKTEVDHGVLSVYTKGHVKSKANVKVRIKFHQLNRIEQSGASELRVTNTIISEDFSLKGSGAIEIDLALAVNRLSIDFSGASDIKLSGTANKFDLSLSGASNLKASEMIAQEVFVDISGASDVKVYADQSISGRASGASSINVKGNPELRNIETSAASNSSFNGKEVENKALNYAKDTTKIKWVGKDFVLINDSIHVSSSEKRFNHWAGIDLGINGFFNAQNSIDLANDPSLVATDPSEVTQFMELNYRKSWTFSINFMEFFIKIKEHHFGIVTGLGTEWNNYELKHNIRLTAEGGSYVYPTVNEFNQDYTWGEIDTNITYAKNRFKTWFINAPLLLEINTGNKKKKSFHLSAGAIFGLNLQTKIKYNYKDTDGSTKKEKDKQSFNTNVFRVSLTTRVGYGRFNVFASYSLTPLFENGRGPGLYPFTVGLTLVGF